MLLKLMLVLISFSLLSCRFPEDPNKTLANVTAAKNLRVGTCYNADNEKHKIIELDLINKIASSLSAKVTFIEANQETLYRQLENNEINLVVCAIHQDSPWKEKIAFSDPYKKENSISYVMAISQGENAWLKYINAIIKKQGDFK